MRDQISVPLAIIAIVSTAAGTCLLSLLGYYLFHRRHRAKQRAHEEERQVKDVNAALDRAIVSYIAKEPPSSHGPSAPDGPRQPEPVMTTAVNARRSSAEDDGLPNLPGPYPEPRAPTPDRRQSLRRTETSSTDTTRWQRRTASSHFMDSAERVYADILARPLEHDRTRSLSRPAEPAPAARDDVGWPLPSNPTLKESWL
ncbi:hypothetical protein C8A00DRAFT_46379 [Chaetomidium leptoderma]|uniref:Uncharacterized protein n=1 Tax=Chaetomidium leptoderma TaxID=669021 RepID=A0AAN6VF41_9PEZI|nr:hypothetical protein C8A00DRAFT_46379 [Chaetomidium leptoderma]